MVTNPRRVVTGHSNNGKSVFVSDGPSPRHEAFAGMPGFAITAVWATDHGMTALPGSNDPTAAMTTFVPAPGGTRLVVTVLPPETQGAAQSSNAEALGEQLAARLPGLAQAMEPDNPGMHTTDTVDYDIVMSGELTLELDDGAVVKLGPGDVVIQNGTRHAWRNRGSRPVIMYSVLVGAPRR
jgi:mannose-6-phosphate isomerase-like protein (cupin superfamily)